MSSLQESTLNDIPYPAITKIVGRPTYVSIRELVRQLKANASAIATDLGGGQHGFLGLILLDNEYQELTGRT
eukprot:CAMPEP_0195511484 /NCGR_PEP_ID=MMETSP0794_2-20130614/3783_1 /TAXON_ID=515487 /ORGANISM="Stephanopyxis turris, Strain CCMP 815" /LENGTH=71 /DNA_ID=CAMNT_0040639083 /DNA_START=51 /DNA_END=262 /DNA_ORIENTATION=-